jgi:1,4-dihydroxy-2-naphthoyl-CoA hydrolase
MTVDEVNQLCKNTLIDHLGIEFTEIGSGFVIARMPVDNRTMQPMNLLHGGATMALAETVGSVGSYVMVDQSKFDIVGIEINANHIGNTNAKYVVAKAEIIHKGQKTHVWDIRISDQYDRPISVCRLTNMIIEKIGGRRDEKHFTQ